MKKLNVINGLLIFISLSMLCSLLTTSLTAFNLSGTAKKDAYFLAFEIILGLGLVFLPSLIAKKKRFVIPEMLYLFYLLFIYGSVYLGTVNHFYSYIKYWDKGLHLISGPLVSAFGLSVLTFLVDAKVIQKLTSVFVFLYGVAFSVLGGVLWEFYEFTCDSFGMNLQRYMKSGKPLLGRAALLDTMGDLWMDFLGAVLFMLFVAWKLKKNHNWLEKFSFHKI